MSTFLLPGVQMCLIFKSWARNIVWPCIIFVTFFKSMFPWRSGTVLSVTTGAAEGKSGQRNWWFHLVFCVSCLERHGATCIRNLHEAIQLSLKIVWYQWFKIIVARYIAEGKGFTSTFSNSLLFLLLRKHPKRRKARRTPREEQQCKHHNMLMFTLI